MRAREFITEVTRPDDRWIATTILTRGGWHIIGSGSFASIYEKEDTPYVLKLFDGDDEAYLAFAHLVREFSNPHFPKLIGKPIRVSKGFHALRMEKLSPYRGDPDLFHIYTRYRDYPAPEGSYTANQMSDVEEIFYDKPTLKDALDIMIDHLTPQYDFDLQSGNIMMRNREIVFTDPVCIHRDGHDRPIMPVPYRAPKAAPKPASKAFGAMMSDDDLMKELGV